MMSGSAGSVSRVASGPIKEMVPKVIGHYRPDGNDGGQGDAEAVGGEIKQGCRRALFSGEPGGNLPPPGLEYGKKENQSRHGQEAQLERGVAQDVGADAGHYRRGENQGRHGVALPSQQFGGQEEGRHNRAADDGRMQAGK